jgi:hypothetical protein
VQAEKWETRQMLRCRDGGFCNRPAVDKLQSRRRSVAHCPIPPRVHGLVPQIPALTALSALKNPTPRRHRCQFFSLPPLNLSCFATGSSPASYV